MAEITVKKIVDTANDIYGVLYRKEAGKTTSKDTELVIRVCVQLYDCKMKTAKFKNIIRACVKYREDVYSSDREVASFMLALEKLGVDY